MSELMDYVNQMVDSVLTQRDEAREDMNRAVQWWWANHQRDFFDYGAGDEMWMELAKKYNVNLPPPVSAVEAMHRRWDNVEP